VGFDSTLPGICPQNDFNTIDITAGISPFVLSPKLEDADSSA
jgi:hypothetical protein